jgi:hypothetical protein
MGGKKKLCRAGPGGDASRYRDLVIPATRLGQQITAIGNRAFWRHSLTSLVIPDSVTSIGVAAFGVNSLTSLVIPDGVTSIGALAFLGNSLTSLVISSSVTSIGETAFASNSLTNLVIPDGVTSIGPEAFTDNPLISVVIPASVTDIESYRQAAAIALLRDAQTQTPITRFAGANVSYKENKGAIQYGNRSVDFPKFYKSNGMKAGRYTYEYSRRRPDGTWSGNPAWRYSPE